MGLTVAKPFLPIICGPVGPSSTVLRCSYHSFYDASSCDDAGQWVHSIARDGMAGGERAPGGCVFLEAGYLGLFRSCGEIEAVDGVLVVAGEGPLRRFFQCFPHCS